MKFGFVHTSVLSANNHLGGAFGSELQLQIGIRIKEHVRHAAAGHITQ